MKKIFLAILLGCIGISVSAQVFVGGQFGVNLASTNNKLTSGSAISTSSFSLAPNVGYKFNDKISTGGRIGLSFGANGADNSNLFGVRIHPYFRYALLSLGNFSIAAEANIGFGVQNTNGKSEGIGTSKMSSLNFSVAAVPVLLYQLNKHIALEANLNILRLGVNVNNTKITSTPNGGNPVTTKDDNVTSFILGANANDVFGSNIGAVTIGFTYAF